MIADVALESRERYASRTFTLRNTMTRALMHYVTLRYVTTSRYVKRDVDVRTVAVMPRRGCFRREPKTTTFVGRYLSASLPRAYLPRVNLHARSGKPAIYITAEGGSRRFNGSS